MSTNKMWDEFCDQLREAGQVLVSDRAPQDDFNQAEGVRYLTRLLRYATLNLLEKSDPFYPQFTRSWDPNVKCKIGADNPDNFNMRAYVSGHYRYRISGTRGTVPLLSFGSKIDRYHADGTLASTGELGNDDIPVDADGRFSFIASQEKPAEGAWLPLSDATSVIIGRQSFQDRATEVPAEVHIEVLDDITDTAPLDPVTFGEQLRLATSFVKGTARTFADWTRMFMAQPNQMPDWGQDFFQTAGGDPSIFYLHGYWRLGPGEVWVIETEVPDCRYWNFVLQTWWMESLDYDRMKTHINNNSANLNDDGTVTIVVCPEDPGFGNWISTGSHDEGTALLRWVHADRHPIPTCKIVKL